MSTAKELATQASALAVGATACAFGAPPGWETLALPLTALGAIGVTLAGNCAKDACDKAEKAALKSIAASGAFRDDDIAVARNLLKTMPSIASIDTRRLAELARDGDWEARVTDLLIAPLKLERDQDGVRAVIVAVLGASLAACRADDGFRGALTLDLLLDAVRVNGVMLEKLDSIEGKLDRLASDLKLTQAERDDLKAKAARAEAELGTTQTLIAGFLQNILNKQVPNDQIAASLFEAAVQWKEAGARISALEAAHNLSPRLHALKAEAERAYRAEDVDRTWAILTEIETAEAEAFTRLEEERRQIDTALADYRRRQIDTKSAKLPLARTRQDVAGTARLLVEILELETPDPAGRVDTLRRHQDDWYERGRDRGLNFDLDVSIALARQALMIAASADQRGAALNDLGTALATLGEREGSSDRLVEAVAAYRDALQERTRDRVPLDWAMTQNNLGNALQTLGGREGSSDRLVEAVAAYRDALLEWTRDRVPLQWAMTQNNLGTALKTLGEREGSSDRLVEAVAAYRDALLEWTRDRVPLQWAATQMNLGNALATLGGREGSSDRLVEAVAAYRDALQEWTRDRVPLDWAMTQENIALAFASLAAVEPAAKDAHLRTALSAVERALEVYSPEASPWYFDKAQRLRDRLIAALGAD
jgi:tetratricopeptide (TPR) repeat protein